MFNMTRDTEHIQFIDNEVFTLLQEPTQMIFFLIDYFYFIHLVAKKPNYKNVTIIIIKTYIYYLKTIKLHIYKNIYKKLQ